MNDNKGELLFEHRAAIDAAFRRAVREALAQHKRKGNSVAVWRDGKVVLLTPDQLLNDISDEDAKTLARQRVNGEIMQAHKVETTIKANGTLLLEELPFGEGAAVEVIVLERPTEKVAARPEEDKYPLRGTVYKYDDPFEPAVPPEDWEALR